MNNFTLDIEDFEKLEVSPDSRNVLSRFVTHTPEAPDLSNYPDSRLAAVLILLYERDKQLHVLLTTRSKLLRSHPGQTALPGGRYEPSDENFVETAFREAHEEVALPRHTYPPAIHPLCLLRPFVSLHKLLVTPVVAYLSDLSVLENLSPSDGEVDRIFDHPLEAILDPSLAAHLKLVPRGSEHWPYDTEYHNSTVHPWFADATYRMHRFRSTASPIKGLTADILITAAEIGYGRSAEYDRWGPGQPCSFADIQMALQQQERNTPSSTGQDAPLIAATSPRRDS
ncbi:hypothetical protein BD410DRAFT_795352 [Rickenella mellea]|uniref:Nudix hydrolase domain-containing protein n=1 Tax=Rickenella mellea TaxID=50990 RepID=A0A4Y7PM73_9AGAM|nr:hypothetical protein BD410DRAFT_795352 [Rickenella mellea]